MRKQLELLYFPQATKNNEELSSFSHVVGIKLVYLSSGQARGGWQQVQCTGSHAILGGPLDI